MFNEVTTAIRESLDYRSMLQKIVATIGKTFEVSCCILKPVEGDRLTPDEFIYKDPIQPNCLFDPTVLIEKVLATRQYQLDKNAHNDLSACQVAVPLTYQQQLLAVLALYQ